MGNTIKIAIVGSGPAGLSAAAHAAALGLEHVLLEAQPHLSNTIHQYQRGKHVMAEPSILPLRSDLGFEAGKREAILARWNSDAAGTGGKGRHRSEVVAIRGERGSFALTLASGEQIAAHSVVLAIGMQGNLRQLDVPGAADADCIQYQLDDPKAYSGEDIVVVGAGDAAIENALALADGNRVTIINRRDGFDRAKQGNHDAIVQAAENGRLRCQYNSAPLRFEPADTGGGNLVLQTDDGELALRCDRVIARLGATPPRRFVEACGVRFPSDDPAAVPELSNQYESNVPGLFVIGALAGFPLIKQAMNQGYEVIEFIQGRTLAPADEPLLLEKFAQVPGWAEVDRAIAEIRGSVPLLAPLTGLQLREFLLDSQVHTPRNGSIVFKRNDYSNTFYSIVRGKVWIALEGADKDIVLGAGEFFGEIGLISGRRRNATVTAADNAVLIESPRRTTNKLINSVAEVRHRLDQAFLLRAIQAQLAPEASKEDLADIVETAELCQYRSGEQLFKEGDQGEVLHLIRRGSVMISREIGGRDVVLAYVPAGQYIGEMAVLSDLPRSATATAAVQVETIQVPAAPLRRLLQSYPAFRERMDHTFKERMAANAASRSGHDADGSVLSFLMAQGLGEATDVLLIDESLCVHCDQCETACAATHGQLSRLDREAGARYANLHIPTSCRHCEHPHCMKDCPPDAIRRAPSGEVHITDACIGCGNCERNCPYGVIQMGVEQPPPSLWSWLLLGLGNEPGRGTALKDSDKQKTATKCDMCKGLSGGPACVRACPTGAAQRVKPEDFASIYRKA